MSLATASAAKIGARRKLLDAALVVIRQKGYCSTSVDDLCAHAGVTKGAFFHHFKSKDALAVEAANHWSQLTAALFEGAAYHRHPDPLGRLLGYIDFRRELIQGEVAGFSCLVGTMAQETFDTHPDIRDACASSIAGHALTLEGDITLAMKGRGIEGPWTAESLALHTQAVLQGAFILAKTRGAAVALGSVDHLRRYIELLFASPTLKPKEIQ